MGRLSSIPATACLETYGTLPGMPDRTGEDARDEALFRDVNETFVDEPADPGDRQLVYCECPDSACVEEIALTVIEYEAVRGNPRRFIIRPGHVQPEIETVVARHDGYWVVEKQGRAGSIAEATDPRS